MPKATFLSYLGIAKETTSGTAAAPTAFIPVTTFKPADDLKYLEDKGYRGALVDSYGLIAGPQTSTYDYDANVHLDTVGYALAGVLGDVTTTGTGTYSHVISTYNGTTAPTTYTITDYSAVETRQNPGCQFSEVAFKFSGTDLFSYSAKAIGLKSVVGTTPIPAWSTFGPMAGWSGAVQIGGASNMTVLDGEVTIKRPVNPLMTVGSQSPYSMWDGVVSVEGKLTLIMEDATQLQNYLSNSQPSVDIKYAQGASSLELHSTKAAYKTAIKDRSKDYLELQVTWQGLANTTDIGASGGYSAIKATLANTMPSGTYK